jgi:hypothetical protein
VALFGLDVNAGGLLVGTAVFTKPLSVFIVTSATLPFFAFGAFFVWVYVWCFKVVHVYLLVIITIPASTSVATISQKSSTRAKADTSAKLVCFAPTFDATITAVFIVIAVHVLKVHHIIFALVAYKEAVK